MRGLTCFLMKVTAKDTGSEWIMDGSIGRYLEKPPGAKGPTKPPTTTDQDDSADWLGEELAHPAPEFIPVPPMCPKGCHDRKRCPSTDFPCPAVGNKKWEEAKLCFSVKVDEVGFYALRPPVYCWMKETEFIAKARENGDKSADPSNHCALREVLVRVRNV